MSTNDHFFPAPFAARMRDMLGEDYDAFVAAYDRPIAPALRINPDKVAATQEANLLPCLGEPVPWADHGYYFNSTASLRPGKHAYHEAGLYYIQEASAMIPAALCPPESGDRVLDLCAAPGGKSTQLAAAMGGQGLLVANEIHAGRAAILSQNMERMGLSHVVVTNASPVELAGHFPGYFDKIVVDAPCSGEGMFRKEAQALTMWSQENVDLCAARQDEILAEAAKMLAPGGYLTYSTCTFAPEENEGSLVRFLTAHPEFDTVDSVNPRIVEALSIGLLDHGNPAWVPDGDKFSEAVRRSIRLFPHHTSGEGHFAVLLRKSPEAASGTPFGRSRDGKNKKGGKGKPYATTPSTTQAITQAVTRAWGLFEAFAKSNLTRLPAGTPCLFGDRLYLLPPDHAVSTEGLHILRAGLCLGTVKSNRLEPDHALALALNASDAIRTYPLDTTTGQEALYLHGDVLPCDADLSGWCLVLVDGHPLGWGKAGGGMLKNHYPKGLRRPL